METHISIPLVLYSPVLASHNYWIPKYVQDTLLRCNPVSYTHLDVYKRQWQQRPLEGIYAVVFLDAIHYHVRSEGQIVKKAVYIATGIDLDGRKDVLGMWVGENESAKFWATVLNGLKNETVPNFV